MTEGLVFECFYTRRYRPLRGKMTTFMAVIFLWQFPPLFFAISPKNSSYSPPYFCYFARTVWMPHRHRQQAASNGKMASGGPPGHGRTQKNDNLSGCRYFGAENGARTRDLNLGKVALYQLSYFRIRFPDWDCKYTTIF